MGKIPIALFAYNFPHKKTQDFIFRLLVEGYNISVIYAANPVSLNIPNSSIKSKINHIGLVHPQQIAKSFGIRYEILDHNSMELKEDALQNRMIAVISGARILKRHIIECFPDGVINFHPGIIPYARGLDALLWSIYNDCPLGVTAHLIDSKIDAGKILDIQKIKINQTDTILDLSERLYEIQLDMLSNAIEYATLNKGYFLDNYGEYNRKMDSKLELEVVNNFPNYIKKWSNCGV